MKNITYFILLFLAMMAFSCEKEIPFPEQETKPKLVVNAAFSSDSLWSVHVSKSIPVSQSGSPEDISTANVKLLDEAGTLITTLDHTSKGFYEAVDYKPEAGKSYRIEVSADGFETATADGAQPKDFSFSIADTSRGNFLDYEVLFIDLDIVDDGGEDNYYFIQGEWHLTLEDEPHSFTPTHFVFDQNTDNNEISSDNAGYDRVFLPDNAFNGETYQTRLAVAMPYDIDEEEVEGLVLYVSSVDPHLYKYTKTLDRYYYNNDELFSEPVQIYNNIQNGLGVFGGFLSKPVLLEF